jgi:hypothetical protein
MFSSIDVPELAIVRALTAGGPFAEGDRISVAFTNPTIGRLVPHGRDDVAGHARQVTGTLLPETISAEVESPAGPYERDDILTLSFVDPSFARIHAAARADRRQIADPPIGIPTVPPAEIRITPPMAEIRAATPLPQSANLARQAKGGATLARGVRFSLSWSDDRVRRFVQVTDKLFTVDRLGWYRHAFVMRLLVPDEISCGDPAADAEAARYLRTLRSASLETLGRPLIAAFMPAFSVTPDWLDTIDSPDAAKALVGLRDAIAPFASHDAADCGPDDATRTCGSVSTGDLQRAPASSVEALLPFLIANVSAFDDVTERLTTYRQALVDLFGGTAQSAETVRLGQMAQPNHTLDDRLWLLVGTVSQRFGGLAVA